jgi:hypothetical protein
MLTAWPLPCFMSSDCFLFVLCSAVAVTTNPKDLRSYNHNSRGSVCSISSKRLLLRAIDSAWLGGVGLLGQQAVHVHVHVHVKMLGGVGWGDRGASCIRSSVRSMCLRVVRG